MQADGRLIEDVTYADQTASELRGQADALRLAAGERDAGAVEREVAQADRVHEPQALPDLAQDGLGYHGRLAGETHLVEQLRRLRDRQLHQLVDVPVADAHRQRFGPQTRPVATLAYVLGLIVDKAAAAAVGAGGFGPAFEIGDDALELDAEAFGVCLARPVKHDAAEVVRQVLKGGLRFHVEGGTKLAQGCALAGGDVALRSGPGGDGVGKREVVVRDDELFVKAQRGAQTAAGLAGAIGRVEAEGARRELGQGYAATGAGVALAEGFVEPAVGLGAARRFPVVRYGRRGGRTVCGRSAVRGRFERGAALAARGIRGAADDHDAVAEREGKFDRVGQAGADFGPQYEPVDHDVDVEFSALRQFR